MVISAMRDLIVTNPETDGRIVTSSSRELRKLALELIKLAKRGDLKSCFEEDLQHLDLYGTDFAGQQLPGMNFSGSFLVEADFRESNLVQAEFAGAYIRSVNFAKPIFQGPTSPTPTGSMHWVSPRANFARVRPATLRDCPATVAEMYAHLEKHYALSFQSWSGRVREQLTVIWNEYLTYSPGACESSLQRSGAGRPTKSGKYARALSFLNALLAFQDRAPLGLKEQPSMSRRVSKGCVEVSMGGKLWKSRSQWESPKR